MSFDLVVADLQHIYPAAGDGLNYRSRARLTEHDLQKWTALVGLSRPALYDEIAVYLARGFHTRELTFDYCDAIVNDIHGVITSADELRPDLFWEVYLSFDEGEYYHNDNRDQDPAEQYTRPSIARIIESISSR